VIEAIAQEISVEPKMLTPWLRWAGGKRKLSAQLTAEIMATSPKLYVEPFLGGGAIALALPPELPKVLADINHHLIDCWLCIQKIPTALLGELRDVENGYGNDTLGYINARQAFNEMIHNPRLMWARRSALFIYLNARSFNGLWRTNGAGRFNVPFGKLDAPRWLGANELARLSIGLARCTLRATDFIELFASNPSFGARTAIYVDPPYDGTFDGYAKDGFDEGDQQLLSDWLELSAQRGAAVWASNADTPRVREMYRWAQIEESTEQHSVGPTAERRGKKGCLLIRGGAACR
jgi:DNA adenine methylase